MQYSWLTFIQARQQLAARLADQTNQLWTDPENGAYIVEALRTHNALTFTWKTSFASTLAAASSPQWLSLGTLAGSPRLRSVTDTVLYTLMQYHLLEPPSGGVWTGTTQFSIADLQQALQRCRDEAIQFANTNQQNPTSIPTTPGDTFINLPDNFLDVPRARFGSSSSTTFGSTLEQDQSNSTLPQEGDFSGVSPFPSIMLGACSSGDVFDNFNVVQPDSKLFLKLYSNAGLTTSINLASVGSSVTAPAGTTFFTISATGATAGGNYNLNFRLNGLSYSFVVGPSGSNYETDIGGADDDAAINGYPLVAAPAQSVVTVTDLSDTDNPYFIVFYDADLGVISSAAASLGVFTSPAGAAYVSFQFLGATTPNTASSVIYTVAVAITVGTVAYTTLMRTDTTVLNYFQTNYPQTPPDLPKQYNIASLPPLQLQVDIAPAIEGGYDLIALIAPAPLTPPTPSLLSVPDDCVYALKWGALADLLSRESEATDLIRAKYAKQRYQDLLKVMSAQPWIMRGFINGVTANLVPLTEMDWRRPEWDSSPPDFQTIVTAGIDFFTVVPDPDNLMSVTIDMLGNAPVPVADGDYIQCSRDVWDAILDYAQFLAAYKQGGYEFLSAMPLEANFYAQAMKINGRLEKLGLFANVYDAEGMAEIRVQERFDDES